MSDATTEPITWEAYNPGYLLMDANARTNGGVVYGRRILKRRPRADPHLDSQHAPAHRGGNDLGERPAAAGGPEGSVATEQRCAPAERTRQ